MAAQVALRRQQESDEAASHLSYGSMQLCFNPNMHKASRIIPPSPTSPREGQITQRSASLSSRSSSPNDEVSNEFESPTSSANEGKLDKLLIILAAFSFTSQIGKIVLFEWNLSQAQVSNWVENIWNA